MSSRSQPAGISSRRSERRSLALPVGVLLCGVWGVGQLARDRTLVTAWAFYLPSAVVAGALVLLALGTALRRHWRRSALLLLLALPALATVGLLENRWRRPAGWTGTRSGGADLRVAAWNAADFPRGVERAAALLKPLDLDLILLSEAPGRPPQELARRLGGELRLTPLGSMALLAHGEVPDVEWLARDSTMQVALVRWEIAGRSLGVLAVNLLSSPRVARDPLLARIVGMLRERSPDLVLGDFNAPRRSRALARLPPGFRHAYDDGGIGWSATWPAKLPLLAIDQTIVGPRLDVRDYRLQTTRISDHRLQVTEVDFRLPAAAGSG